MATEVEQRLARAKDGDRAELGDLLKSYQGYLRLLAKLEIGRRLQGKVDPSDVVQETFLDAHRYFDRFEGRAEGQFVQWLRSILAGTLANTVRRYFGTKARDPRLERELASDLNHSSIGLSQILVDPNSSPSQHVIKGEQSIKAFQALARLADDYQTVIVHRHLEGLTFPQIAERLGKSVDSVEKLWVRGMAKLRKEFAAGET